MPDYKFGDLICYKGYDYKGDDHDAPLMYVGPCWHSPKGGPTNLIDILDITRKYVDESAVEHKDPSMWQRCLHYEVSGD